ncbi:hypothetical protein F8C76_01575 [Flagellimonas olearia]|uniref:ABC transporter permease n=1 Tax=Flagellimonas olearia TaxID=552546 RepID=A0A6I1DXI0_9FLAO|nr:hypothetical protein [Allomuricauda olearia]KAB7530226.1 hypothetical protein F8C76_01575 [Allomuricauda olearia]
MLKAIVYKEWIKIKRVSLFLLLIGVLIVIGIYSNVRHELIIKDAESYWNGILQQRAIWFYVLKFVPLIVGLLIAVAQFVPEIVDKRIKLTLHLPTNEETIVLKMVLFGFFCTTLILSVFMGMFLGMGAYFFPQEIVWVSFLTTAPWFLAGIAAYFLISFIVLEPLWKQRIFYMLFGAAFLGTFFKGNFPGTNEYLLWPFVGLIACISIATLFSIYRFRKGEM